MRFTLTTKSLGVYDVIVAGGGIAGCSFEWGEPGTGESAGFAAMYTITHNCALTEVPSEAPKERMKEYL